MRNQVKLFEDDTLIESFHFAPIHPGSLSEDDYNRIEKEVSEYCEADGLDFWEDNIHMTINGKEYEKNPRDYVPVVYNGITVGPDPDAPYFEPQRYTGGGYESPEKPTERTRR